MNAVELHQISKRYGTVQALNQVSLAVESGTLHAIVGENGAGKTTLMKALYGAMIPDSGEIIVNGQRQNFRNSAQAIAARIGMVSQHYGIIGELTNLENLALGTESAWINREERKVRAIELAQSMGFEFDWDQESSRLSPAGAQKLEILKLLWREASIMILDEPTAMLSPEDGKALFKSLQQLAVKGATILLVTHRLPEVFDYCQKVTILRGGNLVGNHLVSEVTPAQLATEIVGGDVIERIVPETSGSTETGLRVSDLTMRGRKGEIAVKQVSFELPKGRITGIAGVDGSGQRELFRALIGVQNRELGQIHFGGTDWTNLSTHDRIQAGLRVIPEDRHEEAILEDWDLVENARLGLQRLPIDLDLPQLAAQIADRFSTKHGGIRQPIRGLSGGNQQRFVAARALQYQPKLILAFQPARGLDLNSTTKVYQGIRAACEEGATALVVSFDLDELLDFCDEVVVMNHGQITRPERRDRDLIGKLMVSA